MNWLWNIYIACLLGIAAIVGFVTWGHRSAEPPLTCPPGYHMDSWTFNGQTGQGCMK